MKAISSEKISYIIVKSREFDAKEAPVIEDINGHPSEDDAQQILADQPDDPVYEELTSFMDSLSNDEKIELHAMIMLGRGDVDMAGWRDAVQTAEDDLDDNLTHRMLEIPLISDYLADALSQFGHRLVE